MDAPTASIDIDRLNLRQLLQVANVMTRQAEELRRQRIYLRQVIDKRIAAGEREHDLPEVDVNAFAPPQIDAVAEGVFLEAKPTGLSH
jgi:hypothetical protein